MSSIGEIQYKDKPDISYVWLKHMDRVNMMSGEEAGSYNAYVRQQFRLLPTNMQQWVLGQADLFKKKDKQFIYKKILGRTIGSEEKPNLIDKSIPVKRFEDGSIDWKDPNIYSPIRKEVEVVDYETFNSLILAAAEKAGLSWNVDEVEVDAGDTLEHVERKKTPLWWRGLKREQDEQSEREEALQDAEGKG